MAGRTQSALYSEIDLALSWSEEALPQAERTKHVHGVHPYLGKYVPQLVETFLTRYFRPGEVIFDPFVGSGTTLVEANVFGAVGIGCDISAFNCLLARVKTGRYSLGELELALRGVRETARRGAGPAHETASAWLRAWHAPRALQELLCYRETISEIPHVYADVARVILSRAARSARRTTHFDLDFPPKPTMAPYYCHKHKRTCRPVEEAAKFLDRYTLDTIRRIRAFAPLRTGCDVTVLHDDSRTVRLPTKAAGIITSPPYPGLIDYHEQHRYAYELLGLDDRTSEEIGSAAAGRNRSAITSYVSSMSAVFANARGQLVDDAHVLIVVNDSRDLYPDILAQAGLILEERLTRHVNRRTGRRAGEYFEDILVCRPNAYAP